MGWFIFFAVLGFIIWKIVEFFKKAEAEYQEKVRLKKEKAQTFMSYDFPNYKIDYDGNEALSTKFTATKQIEYDKYLKYINNHKHNKTFVAFDLETTGLDAYKHKIIEIGAVRFEDGIPIESFQTYVNKRGPLSPKIKELTGIDDETIKNAPKIETVLPQFLDFIGNSNLVAHNASFDMEFLLNALYNHNLVKPKNKVIDTLKLSRKYHTRLDNHKLITLKEHLYIDQLPGHNSVADSLACAYVYMDCIDLMDEENEI